MTGKKFKEKIHERYIMKKREATMLSHSPTNAPIPPSRRISADYLREETEIQKIIQAQPLGESLESQTERDIAFFTTAVSAEEDEADYTDVQPHSDGNLTEISERSLHSGSAQEPLEGHDTPIHLASSYIQIDDHVPPIERIKETIIYDEDLITSFEESRRLSRRNVDFSTKNIEEEGLYRPTFAMTQRKMQFFEEIAEQKTANTDETDICQSFLQLPELPNPDKVPTIFVCLREDNLSYTSLMLDHKILSLHLTTIFFEHHPLYSEEHVLGQKVENLYKKYSEMTKSDSVGKLHQKLITLRRICKDLTAKEQKSDDLTSKLLKTRIDLKKTRHKLHEEEEEFRKIIKTLLTEYKKLKTLREKQKYNLTTIKLTITAMEVDKDEDEQAFNKDFSEELEELLEEAFQEYLEEKKKYKELLKSIREGDEVPDTIEKPNVEELQKDLQETYAKSKKAIGEPLVNIALSKIEKTPPKNSPREIHRMQKVETMKFLVRISLNDEVVDVVKDLHLDEDFNIRINTSISVRLIRKLPEKIKLQIFEVQNMIPRVKIASITFDVPEEHSLIENSNIEDYDFKNNRDIPSDVGVGTGKYCQVEGFQDLYTHGKVFLKIGWSKTKKDHEEQPESIESLVGAKIVARKWRDQLSWDPLDPDQDFTSMDKMEDRRSIENDDIPLTAFTEIFDDEKLAFCPPEVVENNTRLNLLIERARLTAQFKDMKLIPQIEREIQLRRDSKIIDETLGMDPIDLARHHGKKNLIKMFSDIAQINEIANRENEDTRLLFREDAPTLGDLWQAILGIFGSKRPLRPTIKRNQAVKQTCRFDDCQKYTITVNVGRAFGIPCRSDDQLQSVRRSSNLSSAQQSFRTLNVRPYVVVLFKDKTARTATAEGSNPTWNEQLQIPINFKLDQLKGSLCIQLFDEYVDDLLDDDRLGMSEIYQRISRKWIGELRIPISSIYRNQKIEGTFELDSPKILLGYSKSSLNPASSSMFADNLPDTRGPIYLSLFIGLEPNFEQQYFTIKYLECLESDQIKATIQYWSMEYSNEFPHRYCDPLITLSTGKRVTITKLLGALEIPFDLRDSSSEFLVRRYVSLIPVLGTVDPCSQLTGLWLNNHEILTNMYATPKDLAVLLTCFYIYLDINVWLIFGEDRVSGPTCYVLTRETGNFFITDPVSGRKYSSSDTYCPLVKVSLLANQHNVWGNIQSEKRVYLTQFDVKKSVDWRPLFRKNVDIPGDFLQDTTYEYKRNFAVHDLQKVIEMKLMKKISQWRGHRKTIWNRFLRDQLKYILVELESAVTLETSIDEQMEKINVFLTTFKASGFPLNIPYYSLSNVVERVKSTGIHMNLDSRVEFALAVHIHPYKNNILSVWIFLLSLLPKV
ncbi:Coiled-coil and C2 domain-containing protein 2A [Sergentomyia squamirostris]